MTVIWLADNLFLHPGTIPVKIVWLESSTISLIYDPGSQQSVLKTENEEKWIWFWRTSIQIKKIVTVTEYPPDLQWAVCNFRRGSRGVFSSHSIGATLSQQTQSVSGLPHLHPSCVFHSRPEMNAFIFRLPPLFFKNTAAAPPIKVPLYFCLLSSTSVLSLSFLHLVTIKRCLSRFPFLSISIQGWLEHLCRRPTLSFCLSVFLSFFLGVCKHLSSSLRVLGERSRCWKATA